MSEKGELSGSVGNAVDDMSLGAGPLLTNVIAKL